MPHTCSCGRPAHKRCSACSVSTAWYCSSRCQKNDWVEHIFDCNPRREITTADHLARAVYRNRFPEDTQTCEDYGFTKAFTVDNRVNLFGLYIGLIERMGISAKTVHKWRVSGMLIQEIKAAYNQLPEGRRGGYYPWFLENQYVLDHTLKAPRIPIHETVSFANRYAGVPDNTWPNEKMVCYQFCTILLSKQHPPPFEETWIKFGFCACSDEDVESELSGLYLALFVKCSFEQFWTSYKSSSLIALFDNHGLKAERTRITHLEDVLAGVIKSVWRLKQFVLSEDVDIQRSVVVDYGFMNCRTQTEREELKEVYKQIFLEAQADPIKLHEAAIAGKIFEFSSGLLKFKNAQKKKFAKLMKNMYPLPDL